MIYKSDRYGFNNPDSQWDSQTIEYLLTGDSYIQGLAVAPGNELAGQIRLMTNDSAISLGVGGNGPLFELATLTEYGGLLKPKKVLWFFLETNDFEDLDREIKNPQMMQYLQDGYSQNLLNQQKEIDNILLDFLEKEKVKAEKYVKAKLEKKEEGIMHKTAWIRLTKLRDAISLNAIIENPEGYLEQPPESYQFFATILNKAKARTEAWGGKLYFVYLPEWSRYHSKKVNHDEFKKKSKIIDMLNNLNIPVIDIHQDVFVDHPDPFSLYSLRGGYGHYNSDGYNKVVKAIIANIKD